MKPKEPTTFPTTTEELTKLVRSIVADALESTAEFCRQMDGLPTTGDRFLDEVIDNLDPAAQAAIVALLRRHGKDERIDFALARLRFHVSKFQAPSTDSVRYWVAFGN